MLPYPNIDPVLVAIGPVQVRWYGLMYVLGFVATHFLVRHQTRRFQLTRLAAQMDNLNVVLLLSLVLGARLGYILFYNGPYFLDNPLEALAVWRGGLSFHGGLLGLILGGWWFCRRVGLGFWQTADAYTVTMPVGLALGRLGNFINGELYGRVSDVPWAMVFPQGGPLPRHPSQLYESLLEGVVLFAILWQVKNRRLPAGSMLGLFLVLYGLFRFVVEAFREPDPQLGFILGPLTMGQLLCSLMLVAGAILFVARNRGRPLASGSANYP
ncbi:MAG: prolipoprotein diacylglyceryl transferase [Thermodesulfobacteriota bacterium]